MSESESETPETIAYLRLRDLGIRSGEGEASYRWAIDYTAMLNAVKVVLQHGSRLPDDIKPTCN